MTDIFRSARLTYRAVNPDTDLPLFQSIHADALGYQNSNPSNIHLPNVSDAREFVTAVSESLLGAIIWLPSHVEVQKGGTFSRPPTAIGQIHLQSPGKHESHHRNSEVGIQILPEWQGKRYGGEAISWVLEYAFRRAGLHRVGIRVFAWNAGAVRLYQRLGFELEGWEREKYWHEGQWWDDAVLGILEGEWWANERGEVKGKSRGEEKEK
jgi:RimJ/RimL family protein N-acetyltransferase